MCAFLLKRKRKKCRIPYIKHSYKSIIGYNGVSFRIDIFPAGNNFFIKTRDFLWNGPKYVFKIPDQTFVVEIVLFSMWSIAVELGLVITVGLYKSFLQYY